MVDIEFTSIETVSQRSQSGLPNGDGEDELSIKKPSLASSVVAYSVERISQNEDDDSITLPSAKVEEWLKYGIQISRESRQRRKIAGSDPEFEALENDPGVEYLDQLNVEVSSSRSRVSGSQSNGQLRQQYSNNSSRELRSQPWFTTAQGEVVDEFLNSAGRNPFHFKEISAESPVNFTIDTDELSGFPDDTTCDLLHQYWDTRYDQELETSSEIAWEKRYKILFVVDGFATVSCRWWTLTLRKTWLRRRLIEIRA